MKTQKLLYSRNQLRYPLCPFCYKMISQTSCIFDIISCLRCVSLSSRSLTIAQIPFRVCKFHKLFVNFLFVWVLKARLGVLTLSFFFRLLVLCSVVFQRKSIVYFWLVFSMLHNFLLSILVFEPDAIVLYRNLLLTENTLLYLGK